MEYRVIRSSRRTIALEITPQLEVVVRAPRLMRGRDVERFVQSRAEWIRKHLEIQKRRQQNRPPAPTAAEIVQMKADAARVLPELVQRYAVQMGVTPTSIKITSAKKRFGSCSGKNGLCFSYLLMRYPKSAIEYVVVHELAHIRQHNHSPAFYREIAAVLPDYKAREKLLK